jgi:hypothetical protein
MNNKSLNAALLQAQKKMAGIGKDGTNEYSKYNYTTAEHMIEECRKVLLAEGLVARRVGWLVVDKVIVRSQFKLTHPDSGESEQFESDFYAVEKKGTPIDKAQAGALTTCLNYWLRDLLLLPRKDEAEMDRRDDSNHEPETYIGTPAQKKTLVHVAKERGLNSKELWLALHEDALRAEVGMGDLVNFISEWESQ